MQRRARRLVAFPVEGGIDYHALRHAPSVIPVVAREVCVWRVRIVAKHFVTPGYLSRDGLGIRVNEELGGVEPTAFSRIIEAIDAVAVKLTRPDLR